MRHGRAYEDLIANHSRKTHFDLDKDVAQLGPSEHVLQSDVHPSLQLHLVQLDLKLLCNPFLESVLHRQALAQSHVHWKSTEDHAFFCFYSQLCGARYGQRNISDVLSDGYTS